MNAVPRDKALRDPVGGAGGNAGPPGATSLKDIRRRAATCTLLAKLDFCAAGHPEAVGADFWRMVRHRFGGWAQRRGLRVSPRAIRDYRRRLEVDGNHDGRGRRPGLRIVPSDGAWGYFLELLGRTSTASVRSAYFATAAECGQRRWTWGISLTTARIRAVATLGREAIKVRSFASWRESNRAAIQRENRPHLN